MTATTMQYPSREEADERASMTDAELLFKQLDAVWADVSLLRSRLRDFMLAREIEGSDLIEQMSISDLVKYVNTVRRHRL